MNIIIDRIANTKVKTKADMIQLVKDVSFAIGSESKNNSNGEFTGTALLAVIQSPQAPEPHNPLYPTLFKQLRQEAQKYGATLTDKAILDSAYWYFKNIENPTQPKNPTVPTPPPPSITPNELNDLEKKEKRSKYIQWGVIGASLIIGSGLIYFAFFKGEKDTKKSTSKANPKNQLRGYRRNGKLPLIKRTAPVLTSSLSEYRKRFDSEQKKAKGDSKIISKSKNKLKLKKSK